jgi:hypothetical protein
LTIYHDIRRSTADIIEESSEKIRYFKGGESRIQSAIFRVIFQWPDFEQITLDIWPIRKAFKFRSERSVTGNFLRAYHLIASNRSLPRKLAFIDELSSIAREDFPHIAHECHVDAGELRVVSFDVRS